MPFPVNNGGCTNQLQRHLQAESSQHPYGQCMHQWSMKHHFDALGIVHCWLCSSLATDGQYISKPPVSIKWLDHVYPSIHPSSLFLPLLCLLNNIPHLSHPPSLFPFFFPFNLLSSNLWPSSFTLPPPAHSYNNRVENAEESVKHTIKIKESTSHGCTSQYFRIQAWNEFSVICPALVMFTLEPGVWLKVCVRTAVLASPESMQITLCREWDLEKHFCRINEMMYLQWTADRKDLDRIRQWWVEKWCLVNLIRGCVFQLCSLLPE